MTLRELRKEKKLTQVQCAKYLGVSVRTYQNYETGKYKSSSIKYAFMMDKLKQYGFIDEEHGILTIEEIKSKCDKIFANFNIDYCYLFGSYAKGKATETSDIDLLVSSTISGMQFFDLVETIRGNLKKKVDILNTKQLYNNPDLINEILKDGVKIYG